MSFYAPNDTFMKYGTLLMVLLYLTIRHFGRRTFQKKNKQTNKKRRFKTIIIAILNKR